MITGIILASGFAQRMNREKLMLTVEDIPVVERVITAAHSSELDEVILVYRRDEIREIAKNYGIKTVYNRHAEMGQSAAVTLGVKSSHPDTDGFMFLVGDQPYLDASTINTLVGIFKKGKESIVVPVYNGQRGNPVIFSSDLREELLALEGDSGGRIIIESMIDRVKLVTIEKSIVGTDIDTNEEYEKLRPHSKILP